MSMVIETGGSVVKWYVGESFPYISGDLKEVYASGVEKDYIIDRFPNIPYDSRRDCTLWFGEMAKFIVRNMAAGG